MAAAFPAGPDAAFGLAAGIHAASRKWAGTGPPGPLHEGPPAQTVAVCRLIVERASARCCSSAVPVHRPASERIERQVERGAKDLPGWDHRPLTAANMA